MDFDTSVFSRCSIEKSVHKLNLEQQFRSKASEEITSIMGGT